jgi:hypothetical protein
LRLKITHIISVFVLFLTASCEKDNPMEIPVVEHPTVKLLHLSHTLDSVPTSFVPGVDQIDFSKYKVLMLGGDLLFDTSHNPAELEYANSIFNLSDENTLWAIGNHDDTSPWMVPSVTGRELYYAHHKDGITYIVLNTQYANCNITNDQLALFNNVVDTIQTSSHLIVMTHKLIWMYGNNHLEPLVPTVSNGQLGNQLWDINPNNFYDDLYWKLLDVQNSGIQVICLAGDIGFNGTEFEHRFDSGIQFLASGLFYSKPQARKALVFEHTKSKGLLTWEYVNIEDL